MAASGINAEVLQKITTVVTGIGIFSITDINDKYNDNYRLLNNNK